MTGKFDFTRVPLRKKNMLDAVGTIAWDSYQMELVSLAETLMTQVSEDAIAQKYPKFLRLEQFAEEPRAIVAVPAMVEGPDTVLVIYGDQAKSVHVDMSPFFAVEPQHIPRGTRAYIPFSRKELPDLGPCLILHFGQAEYKAITAGKKKSTSTAPEATPVQANAVQAPSVQLTPDPDSTEKPAGAN
ncbi:MAG TPA: hypothetical protein VGK74_06745 [Symbiobacteriaceae bacterium]|jgi:hypothetical protein